MSEFRWINVVPWAIAFMGLIFAIYLHFKNQLEQKKANKKVDEAEKEAFLNKTVIEGLENWPKILEKLGVPSNEQIEEYKKNIQEYVVRLKQQSDMLAKAFTGKVMDLEEDMVLKENLDLEEDKIGHAEIDVELLSKIVKASVGDIKIQLEQFDHKVEKINTLLDRIEEIKENLPSVEMKRLFNLYSKQIEKYQVQTRARATWSFMFAIFSMIAGLGFVIWGGSVLLTAKETIVLAAGGIISAIGGGVGSYITKTFLDVHKLSLNQLNRYFKQPVINDHILMAQRLANESDDPDTKKKAYETVINSIAELIKQETEIKKE